MLNKLLSILSLCSLSWCSRSINASSGAMQIAETEKLSIRGAEFTVIEKSSRGYFIRLASAQRASTSSIRELADSLSGAFERIDLCLDVAHERGDEYVSIMGKKVFDHANDNIFTLNKESK